MEYYYKPLNQAFDTNSILSIVGVNPDVMDKETLLEHGLYLVEEEDRDPYLFSTGEFSYSLKGDKAIRTIVETPLELDEAKRIGKLMLREFLEIELDRVIMNSGMSVQVLSVLSLCRSDKTSKMFHNQLNPIQEFIEKIAEATISVDEAEDFHTIKQIVISACKRN